MINQTDLDEVVRKALSKFLSDLEQSTKVRPDTEKRIRIDLSVDRSLAFEEAGYPLRSIQVVNQTDPTCKFELIPESMEDHKVRHAIPLGINDSWDFGRSISRWFIKNDPQPGKFIELLISVDGTFKSGKQVSVSSGGVSILEGSSYETTKFDLTALTPYELFPADADRKLGTWKNENGQCFIGPSNLVSNTGTNKGEKVEIGEMIEWKNPCALWVYPLVGSVDEVKGIQK